MDKRNKIYKEIASNIINNKIDHLNYLKDKPILVLLEFYENPNEKTYNLIRNFLFQFLILKSYKNYFSDFNK